MLQPARRKYRKEHKGRNRGLALRGAHVSFGDFGLKVTERGRLTARQIAGARRAISRPMKRGARPVSVVYELDGVTEALAREAFALAAAKLPLKTTFVVRQLGI